MKLYALFTLHETGWGTRAGVGDRKLDSVLLVLLPLTLAPSCSRYRNGSRRTREEHGPRRALPRST
jgi:hypothetical protein